MQLYISQIATKLIPLFSSVLYLWGCLCVHYVKLQPHLCQPTVFILNSALSSCICCLSLFIQRNVCSTDFACLVHCFSPSPRRALANSSVLLTFAEWKKEWINESLIKFPDLNYYISLFQAFPFSIPWYFCPEKWYLFTKEC